MEEHTEFKPVTPEHPRNPVKSILLILVVLILMGGSAGGAYWLRGNKATTFENKQAATITSLQGDKVSLQKQINTLKAAAGATASAGTSGSCAPKAPDATVIQNIEAAVTSANTAALQGYMASSVDDVFALSSPGASKTPTEAVGDVSTFVTDQITGVWSFPVSASSLAAYRAGSYAQYFPSTAVVGGSTRHRVISFNFDCNAKISTIFFVANDVTIE